MLIKKIKTVVIDNQAVIKTGAVERYFKKSFIIKIFINK
jgi:hypothetical protein